MPKLSSQGRGKVASKRKQRSQTSRCETIMWKFSVPKAPWWGDQFERLIGLIKASMGKHS